MIPLLVVCGPTASGKTKLAVDLAKRLNGEVIGADSMQVYRRMNIGTAKPTAEEKNGVPHHLIDFLEPEAEFSVADYVSLAKQAIADITARGKLPVLAGGTGLYIHSLVDNLQFGQMAENQALRTELYALCEEKGVQHLWDMLHQADPELAQKLHPNNLHRVVRALEVHGLTGIPMSRWQEQARSKPSPYTPCMLGLCFGDRNELYRRIDRRVDAMLEAGLLEEAQSLFRAGYSKTATQAIGYKELWGYFRGESILQEATELLKTQTRRYAKRQMTWFRRDERIHWLEADAFPDYGALLQKALQVVQAGIPMREKE